MKSIFLLAFFVMAIPALSFAQVPAAETKKQTPGKMDVEQTLIKLDRELMDAAVKKDDAAVDRIELANHVFINPGGGVEEKVNVSRTPGSGPTFESVDTSDVVVRIYGDTAVLTGKAVVKGKLANGTDISGPYRYMRVFVKQKGDWRLAATSAVPIGPPPTQPKT